MGPDRVPFVCRALSDSESGTVLTSSHGTVSPGTNGHRSEPTPLTSAQAAYIAETVQAVAKLDAVERDVLTMSYLEQLTQPQIAARLGVPLAAVREAAAHGLRRLAGQIEIGCKSP